MDINKIQIAKSKHMTLGKLIVSSLTIGALLTGCGSGSSTSNEAKHNADYETDNGRLAFYDQDSQAIQVLDIESNMILDSFTLSGEAPRLYASPGNRYGVIIQRNDNMVSFLDSGLYQEDHGDHLHDYAKDPSILNFTLNSSRPTHFTSHEDHSAIFFDGQEGVVSSVALLTDASIESGNTLNELTLSNNMHGVAKLIDDQFFVTYRDPLITETTLPAAIDRYSYIDNTLTFAHRYTEACDRLHGSAATDAFITFGCGDGVLAIDLSQSHRPATKLSNPSSLLEGSRIGSLYAHHNSNEFVGVAGNQFYVIDVNNAVNPYQEITLPDDVDNVLKGFNHDGDIFYILGNDGKLYLYDVRSNWNALQPVQVTNALEESSISPAVTLSSANGSLYILNTNGQEVIEVNSETGSIIRTINLDFTATSLVWLGVTGHDEHDDH
ncbi:MAG: hypothetical protein JXR16_08450 [Bermanella sp.]